MSEVVAMRFRSPQDFRHDQAPKVGVLITNLGTPDAPTPSALRRYLREFLSDPRVVEVPKLLWWLILNLVILVIRPARSARVYRSVWTEQGSPLRLHTEAQCAALKTRLQARYSQPGNGQQIEVAYAMRYGNPCIADTVQQLQEKGVRQLLVLPLYPQYSASTSASTFDALAADFQQRRWLPDLRFVSHYADFQPYIQAMATRIRRHWDTHGRADKLLLSYHGIPKRYLLAGDPYFCECHKTSRLLAAELGLAEQDYLTTFQSRFGREEWLQPYTDHSLKALAAQGVQSVQVFCPGFSADCLETLEEIAVENRHYFEEAGGQRYEYISALNAEPEHIEALAQLVETQLQGWLPRANEQDDEAALCLRRAQALGAKS